MLRPGWMRGPWARVHQLRRDVHALQGSVPRRRATPLGESCRTRGVEWRLQGVTFANPSQRSRAYVPFRGRARRCADARAPPPHTPNRHTRGLQRTFQPVEPASLCDGHDETACAGSSSVTSRRDEGFSTTLLTSPMHSPPEAMNLLNPFVVDVCRAEEANVVDGRQLRRAVTAFTRIRLRGD